MRKGTPGMYRTISTCLAGLMFATQLLAQAIPAEDGNKHMGVATCAASQCHGSVAPRDGVQQNEYVVWTQDDPHSRSYQTLQSDASKRIAAKLGIASAEAAAICLDCHADNVPSSRRGEKFSIADGVGCESCHGGSEQWLSSHDDGDSSGMYPTAEADARAAVCLSCHLGTPNKFATHRIMAAGHPRLSFELDTFTELWRQAGRQAHFTLDEEYRQRKEVPTHTRLWAAGLLTDARKRLSLLRRDLAVDKLVPELGHFDCHACHRPMQEPQWYRLARHANAAPGTLFVTDGSFVMALALADGIAPSQTDAFESALGGLHAAAGSTRQVMLDAMAALDSELQTLQRKATGAVLQNRQQQILAAILRRGADGEFLDYASAEQAFMAVQMLALETGDVALQDELSRLAEVLLDDARYRPATFARMLKQLPR